MKRQGQFRVMCAENEAETVKEFDIVIDCSGTYGNGIPLCVPGEEKAEKEAYLTRIIPEKTGELSVVVGSGYSAITTLKLILVEEKKQKVTWVTDKLTFPV